MSFVFWLFFVAELAVFCIYGFVKEIFLLLIRHGSTMVNWLLELSLSSFVLVSVNACLPAY